MYFQLLKIFSVIPLLLSLTIAQYDVPVPWSIASIAIYNTRHGVGGTWSFSILDAPTKAPHGFNTTCSYYSNTYKFAIGEPPYNAPCKDPSVTFGFFPSAMGFTFNVTHVYACGKTVPCKDNGTWTFSTDDVRGQEFDVGNNFGQAGSFGRAAISMYPTRAIASSKCEFC